VQWRWTPPVLCLILTLFAACAPALASTALAQGLIVLPEEVVLTLPKAFGQEFRVSYTSHPMKAIVDSNYAHARDGPGAGSG